jgi:hypothetical protein
VSLARWEVAICTLYLGPNYFDAAARCNIPDSNGTVAAAADDELALGTQTQGYNGISMTEKSQLTHVPTPCRVEQTDCVVEGTADND